MPHYRDLPLRAKGLVVVAIPIAAFLVVIGAFYLAQKHHDEADLWVEQAMRARNLISQIRGRWEAAEVAVLGYVTTGNTEWLPPYERARGEITDLFEQRRLVLHSWPGSERQADALERRLLDRLDTLGKIRAEAAISPAAARKMFVGAYAQHEAIRNDLRSLRDEEGRMLADRMREEADARRVTDLVMATSVLFALAGGILAMVLFTNTISRRVAILDANASRLARGAPMLPVKRGNDEVGRLAASLTTAATLLAARQRALEDAAAELETRVNERTAELQQANAALAAEVSERTRTQEQLADAKGRLEAVIDASPLAINALDLEGRTTMWSRAAEELFGWKTNEVLGRPLPTVPKDEEQDFRELLARARRGEHIIAQDVRRRRRDGSMAEIRLWVAPLLGPDGKLRGNIGIMTDITGQRRLEQQFAQSQKMEAIGRLAGGVAHDFNNVITVISGYGQMLLEGAKDDPLLREAAEEVLNSADRAAGLARQLLAFSRRQAIQPRVLDLNELISNIQKLLGRVIGEDIELKTFLRPDLTPVLADPGQMEQVLMNLAVNARDAMPNGGKLLIETSNVTLDESYTAAHAGVKPGNYVLLTISDTGTGMTDEVKAHIFEPFFTTKERGRGTGLGLSTVYGIVKQHGGDIWAYSEVGRGATFKIYLPAAAGTVAAGPEAAKAEPARRGTETILVVEDEEAVRKLLRDVLDQRGYRVLEASSGVDALNVASNEAEHIDLLLTDVIMPRMGGRELARRFAQGRPDTPILFLSGYTEEMVGDRGVLTPGANFMSKPFAPEDLARRVREILDRAKEGGAKDRPLSPGPTQP